MAYSIAPLTNIRIAQLHLVFERAFSDYEIPMHMTKEQFQVRFEDKLRIEYEWSPGVWQGDELVGFIYTATGNYHGIPTAYNGGTGIIPSHRGQGLLASMYDWLREQAPNMGVKQFVLEVISTNDRAKKAYENVGFKAHDLLHCFRLSQLPEEYTRPLPGLTIKTPEEPNWKAYRTLSAAKATFQDTWDRLPLNPREKVLEAWLDGKLQGTAVFQPHIGRISALAVGPDSRGKGVGSALIHSMVHQSAQPHLTVINVRDQDRDLLGFLHQLRFKNEIDQYEMVLPLR